jgi:hypothetical protein
MKRSAYLLIRIIIVALLLASLAYTTNYWLPSLLGFVLTNGNAIQALASLIQLLFWMSTLITLVIGVRESRQTYLRPMDGDLHTNEARKHPDLPLIDSKEKIKALVQQANDSLRASLTRKKSDFFQKYVAPVYAHRGYAEEKFQHSISRSGSRHALSCVARSSQSHSIGASRHPKAWLCVFMLEAAPGCVVPAALGGS